MVLFFEVLIDLICMLYWCESVIIFISFDEVLMLLFFSVLEVICIVVFGVVILLLVRCIRLLLFCISWVGLGLIRCR